MEHPAKVEARSSPTGLAEESAAPLLAPAEVHATYLDAPPTDSLMSPYLFGAIEITYVGGRVAAKKLHPHVTQASSAVRR